jgi:signal transduction histidine kinase
VIGLALAWHRARLNRLLEVERLRVRIASDLHDDVSSDLSGVALATALVQGQPYLREGDRDRLADAERTARGILESLRDIVWYINPEHDSVEAMLRRMKSTASSLLGDIAHRFETDLPQADGVVDMALRRNVFLIFKEAVHNVARHSRAENVQIRLEQRAGTLVLEVTDDGIGFDPERVERGDGLVSMRRRAREIGAALAVESRPGGGSTTRLELSLEGRGRTPKP